MTRGRGFHDVDRRTGVGRVLTGSSHGNLEGIDAVRNGRMHNLGSRGIDAGSVLNVGRTRGRRNAVGTGDDIAAGRGCRERVLEGNHVAGLRSCQSPKLRRYC